MVPHLIRAQSTYRDIRKYSFYHTHSLSLSLTHARTHARTHTHTLQITNTSIIGDGLVE